MFSRELETGQAMLKFSRHMSRSLLDGIPKELWYHIPVTGGNPAAWIAYHLAWEDDDCLKDLVPGRGHKVPSLWLERYAQGSTPSSSPSDYPSPAESLQAMDTFRAELNAFFEASADRLDQPLPKGVHGFARDLAALMPAIACHEMVHVGQLTVVRKSLKLKPVFG